MSQSKPGPWHIDSSGFLVTADGLLVQNAKGQYSKADANKMAAAPELVEALEAVKIPYGCWCYQGYFHPHQPQCLKAQAAIAKAKGDT